MRITERVNKLEKALAPASRVKLFVVQCDGDFGHQPPRVTAEDLLGTGFTDEERTAGVANRSFRTVEDLDAIEAEARRRGWDEESAHLMVIYISIKDPDEREDNNGRR